MKTTGTTTRIVLFLVLAALASVSTASASSIAFSPNVANVQPGDELSLDILATDFNDLYSFQFDVSFDPSIVEVSDIVEGGFLGSAGTTFFLPGVIDNPSGTIFFTLSTLIGPDPGVTGSGVIATIKFTALADGSSPVTLENFLFLDSGFGDIDIAPPGNGLINVSDATPVPEPASLLLFGPGIAAVAIRARRKR